MSRYSECRRTVYFIKPIGMRGPVKIGCSFSPDKRRKSLETWSPFPLEIVAEIDGCMDDERRFHALFWDDRQSHEWFAWSAQLQDTIDDINAGRFDLASLPAPRRLPAKRHKEGNGWTDKTRLQMSYFHRIRHAKLRSGYHLPEALENWRCDLDDPTFREKLNAFIEHPSKFGLNERDFQLSRLRRLEGKDQPWAVQARAQILARLAA